MPKRGLLFMLPMRVRAKYPDWEDTIITLPEIVLPPDEESGGSPIIPVTPGAGGVIPSFDFPVREVGSYMLWAPGNAPNPSTHEKESLTFHWEGDGQSLPLSDNETISWLGMVANQHINKDWGNGARGSGIMYHEAIARSGTSFILRPYTDVVWHAGDSYANRTSRAILVIASTAVGPTDAQLNAIRKRTADFNVPIWAHKDWSATQCPGSTITNLVNDLRAHGYA